MKEYEDKLSLRTFEHVEDALQTRGVVVCLSSHRRWRSRMHGDRAADVADETWPLIGEDSWRSLATAVEDKTERATLREPSLLLAGSVALISFASIVGFYWAFLTAMKAVIALSVPLF
jgi:hypothetical protein